MRKSGYYDLLLKRSNDYFRARTDKAKHQLVLSSDKLPLTDTSSSHLHTKMITENSLLLQEVVAAARNIPCNCALMKQDDFKNQKSGLEEIYINHNLLYNKNHQLKFLPKFHP